MPLGKTIAFLGAGNMAEALVKGMLRAGVAAPGEISVSSLFITCGFTESTMMEACSAAERLSVVVRTP